jgi:hypothetical protein
VLSEVIRDQRLKHSVAHGPRRLRSRRVDGEVERRSWNNRDSQTTAAFNGHTVALGPFEIAAVVVRVP